MKRGEGDRKAAPPTWRREDVRLRPIEEADLDRVLEWRNSGRIRANMYTDHIISPEEHRGWFETVRKGEKSLCLVFEYRGRPAGVVTFSDMDRKNGLGYWGFYLGETDLPRGIGSVMGFLGLEHAFGSLGLRKLCGEAFVFNTASIRFFQRLGFVQEGCFVQHVLKNGRYEDVLSFALLKEDWEKERERMEKRVFSTDRRHDGS